MKTSIIIPCYKGEATIQQLLFSIAAQTCKDFNVVLVQDGDKVDYNPIIEPFGPFMDIYVLPLPFNLGPGMARQFGIDYVASLKDKPTYIMFADADDELLPRAVETLSSSMDKLNADIIVSEIMVQNDTGVQLLKSQAAITWCHGKMYRLQYLLDKDIRFLSEVRYNEDSYFNLVASCLTDKMATIEEPTYLWINNPNSITRSDPDYFFRYQKDYLIGQTTALLKLLDSEYGADKVAGTWGKIYQAYETILLVEPQQKSYIDTLVQTVFDNERAKASLKEYKTLMVCSQLATAYNFKNKLIFFPDSFSTWTERFGYKLVEEFKKEEVKTDD